MGKLIKVAVVVLPDGTTKWLSQNIEMVEREIYNFKMKQSKEYLESGVNTGVVLITMTEDAYYNIPATNR
jgi:hypothetical protein